jgi:hypothetical protein
MIMMIAVDCIVNVGGSCGGLMASAWAWKECRNNNKLFDSESKFHSSCSQPNSTLPLFLCAGVISWKECLNNNAAWDTLTWFAALIAMAAYLNKFGFIPW